MKITKSHVATASERPLICSVPMVRAILAGEKTQTRRIQKNASAPVASGDLLWVKETWREAENGGYEYREAAKNARRKQSEPRWKSALCMPQKIARITLEITDVRIERLQDITEADAIAEGAPFIAREKGLWLWTAGQAFRDQWDSQWDSTTSKGFMDESWYANPAVIVLTFCRLT